jgi:hypothetical protein
MFCSIRDSNPGRGEEIYFFYTITSLALRPTQAPGTGSFDALPGALSFKVKRRGFEANHSSYLAPRI